MPKRKIPANLDFTCDWASGASVKDMAAAYGVNRGAIYSAVERMMLPRRNRVKAPDYGYAHAQAVQAARAMHAVILETARVMQVDVADMLSTSRLDRVILARQVAQYVAHKDCGLTLVQIGNVCARHHTTVMSNVRAVAGRMREPALARAILEIRARVAESAEGKAA